MGGLPCAKAIIDNGNALTQAMQCMNASILLSATNGVEPTYDQLHRFTAATEQVAKIASEIQSYVSATTEPWDHPKDSKDSKD